MLVEKFSYSIIKPQSFRTNATYRNRSLPRIDRSCSRFEVSDDFSQYKKTMKQIKVATKYKSSSHKVAANY